MIELKNIERSYKTGHTETWVLRQIRLTIDEGEFVTVMGPSGAGKSSLLNVLALLDDGWLGEYWFGETPAHKLNRKLRAAAGFSATYARGGAQFHVCRSGWKHSGGTARQR